MAVFTGKKTALYAERAEKERRTMHLGGIVGGTAWVGSLRYDARSLARDAGMLLSAALWLRRRVHTHRRKNAKG